MRRSDSANLAKARLGAALSTATGTSPEANGLIHPSDRAGSGATRTDRKAISGDTISSCTKDSCAVNKGQAPIGVAVIALGTASRPLSRERRRFRNWSRMASRINSHRCRPASATPSRGSR